MLCVLDDDAELDEPTPPSPTSSPEVMDIAEAAAFLRMKPRALSNAAQEGRIPARKIGRGWRFSRVALHRPRTRRRRR